MIIQAGLSSTSDIYHFFIYFENIRYNINGVGCIINVHNIPSLNKFWLLLIFLFLESEPSSYKWLKFPLSWNLSFSLPPWCMRSIAAMIMFVTSWIISIVDVTTLRNKILIHLSFYSIILSTGLSFILYVSYSLFSASCLFPSTIMLSIILIMILDMKSSLIAGFRFFFI